MSQTAVAGPDTGLTQAQLAERYGLSVAGARPGLFAYVGQIWAYRHFISNFSRAGIISQLSRARLGRFWQVLTPLMNAAVYYLIFGIILQTSRGIPNFIAWLVAGVFTFTFTSQVLINSAAAITKNLGLIRALHFPRACLPLATTAMQAQNLLASMVVLIVIVLATGEPITLRWLLLIPALLMQAVFNSGLSLFIARLGNKITDVRQVLPFVMRTWMYSSGVMYSASKFREAKGIPHWVGELLQANPMVVYVEVVRHALIHSSPEITRPMTLWVLGMGWAIVALVGGFIYFWLGEQEYGRG
jgi:teichoic acid transport system permease protein